MTIKLQNLTKTYGRKTKALDNVSFELPQGFLGVVGPLGSGKTTLLHTLAGVIKPNTGTVEYDGKSVVKGKLPCTIGFVQQDTRVLPHLSLGEFLDYVCVLKRVGNKQKREQEVQHCLALTGLEKRKEYRISTFTPILLACTALAQALLGDPPLLILDEPTAKLDCAEKAVFNDLLTTVSPNKTVAISSESVTDIAPICSHICVLQHGEVAFFGDMPMFLARIEGATWEQSVTPEERNTIWRDAIVLSAIKQDRTLLRYVDVKPAFDTSYLVKPNMEDAYIYTCGGINKSR